MRTWIICYYCYGMEINDDIDTSEMKSLFGMLRKINEMQSEINEMKEQINILSQIYQCKVTIVDDEYKIK